MGMELVELTDRLVSISDFSQGKAGKIFNDVYTNNLEYIVLKNKQPTEVVISLKEYKEKQKKIEQFEKLLEIIENYKLLTEAERRSKSGTRDFMDFITEEGLTIESLEALSDKVEFE